MTMLGLFMITAGLGAVLRYLADFYLPKRGILFVNILGSCMAGIVLGLALQEILDQRIVWLLLGGFAGSLTTFSTVALTAAKKDVRGTNNPVKTWSVQVGLSIASCLLGMVATSVLLN